MRTCRERPICLAPLALAVLLTSSCGVIDAEEEAEIVYVDQSEALRGLERVHLNPGFASAGNDVLVLPEDLLEQVRKRLTEAGLELATEQELQDDPGLADVQIYPSINGGAPSDHGDPNKCCFAGVWMSVLEGTALDRDDTIHRLLPIWGGGSNRGCARDGTDAGAMILEVVDRFVADWERGNRPKPDPAPAAQG